MVLIGVKNVMLGNFAGKWFKILSVFSISIMIQVLCSSINFERTWGGKYTSPFYSININSRHMASEAEEIIEFVLLWMFHFCLFPFAQMLRQIFLLSLVDFCNVYML